MRRTRVERYNRNRNNFFKQEALCKYKELKIKSFICQFLIRQSMVKESNRIDGGGKYTAVTVLIQDEIQATQVNG